MTAFVEWLNNAYWHWKNVFYFRLDSYEDNIDRLAFFEELNIGWSAIYRPDIIPDDCDYAQLLRNLSDYDDWEVGLEPIPQDTSWSHRS